MASVRLPGGPVRRRTVYN